MRHTRRAFTLVELLVVIGIIAVLISLLMPALAQARKQAQATKCASNMRQFGSSIAMFSQEHKGYVPKAWFNDHSNGGGGDFWYYPWNEGWDEILLGYMSNNTDVFQCPTDELNNQRPTNQFGRPIPGSYRINASNQAVTNSPWASAYKLAALVNATQSILIVEGYPGNKPPWDYTEWQHVATWEGNDDGSLSKTKMWNVAQDRHPRNKANYLFADGHVESLEGSETWTPISGGTITMWRCLYPAGSSADVP